MAPIEQRMRSRRKRDETRSEVVAAALRLAESSAFKDLTVDEIARAAGVSRPAFYIHFSDKEALLLTAVEQIAGTLYDEADRWWHGSGDPEQLVEESVGGVVSVYAANASLMRIATEASTYDEEIREFWMALVGRFIAATAEHIASEQGEGRINRDLEPGPTAESLVWMVERCCYIHLARAEREPSAVTASLTALWVAALYG